MQVLQITTPKAISRFNLDEVRSSHLFEVDAAHPGGEDAAADHVPDMKWLLVVELRPVKVLHETAGQVVDHVQQKEWLFDTKEDAEGALSVFTPE